MELSSSFCNDVPRTAPRTTSPHLASATSVVPHSYRIRTGMRTTLVPMRTCLPDTYVRPKRSLPPSPLARTASPTLIEQKADPVKNAKVSGRRWRYINQAGPTARITHYKENAHGVTEYFIATRFGDGPVAFSQHRFSDFIALHTARSSEPFPVEKVLFVNRAVKRSRMQQLTDYLQEELGKAVEAWACSVRQGRSDASADVLPPDLQAFLGATEVDRGRLDSGVLCPVIEG